jgi:hypothetical protein
VDTVDRYYKTQREQMAFSQEVEDFFSVGVN